MAKKIDVSKLMTATEVAKTIGVVSAATVYYHVERGRIAAKQMIRQGDRTISLFDPKDVEQLKNELEAERAIGGRGHRTSRRKKS